MDDHHLRGVPTLAGRPAPASPSRWSDPTLRLVLACGVLGLLLLAVVLGASDLLPAAIGRRVAHNSEALALALLVVALLAPAARRLGAGAGASARTTYLLVACGLALAGTVLLEVPAASVRTLNEPVLTAAALALCLATPWPLTAVRSVGLLAALVILLGHRASPVVQQAETLVGLVVAALVAVVLPGLVRAPRRDGDARATPGPARAPVLVATLVLLPLVWAVLRPQDPDGLAGYLARGNEASWGWAVAVLVLLVPGEVHGRAGGRPGGRPEGGALG